MDFDLEKTRRDLIATRAKHGADTAIGHRCSNLLGMLDSMKRKPAMNRRPMQQI